MLLFVFFDVRMFISLHPRLILGKDIWQTALNDESNIASLNAQFFLVRHVEIKLRQSMRVEMKSKHLKVLMVLATAGFISNFTQPVHAAPLPGGSLDPLSIPKYITPLVIPPVMPNNGSANSYDIAVRQFQQAILPSGFPATTVWGYGAVNAPRHLTIRPTLSKQQPTRRSKYAGSTT